MPSTIARFTQFVSFLVFFYQRRCYVNKLCQITLTKVNAIQVVNFLKLFFSLAVMLNRILFQFLNINTDCLLVDKELLLKQGKLEYTQCTTENRNFDFLRLRKQLIRIFCCIYCLLKQIDLWLLIVEINLPLKHSFQSQLISFHQVTGVYMRVVILGHLMALLKLLGQIQTSY